MLSAMYAMVYVETISKYRLGHLECPAGKYGKNCLQNCSENCYIAKTCDRKTSVCHKGCAVGWKLPLCNEGTCIFLSTYTIYSLLLSCYYDYFFNISLLQ